MEKREDVLRDALAKNTEETEQWQTYQKENETAIENLQYFSKFLSVDVMVPLGPKALMPGQLIHTNEVLVGHYQGYFSKCSAHTAIEICNLRIGKAKEHLKNLQTEADLWQNKLDRPYLEGVLPSANELEIIEDYDEEQEKAWREEHKKRIKQAKLNEKKVRKQVPEEVNQTYESQNMEKTDADIFQMLEEAELMEELEKELDTLQLNEVNDDTIHKLLTGEMELPKEKTRIAHKPEVINEFENKCAKLEGIVKKSAEGFVVNKPPASNNNTRQNPEIREAIDMNNDNGIDENDPVLAEINFIKEQANCLPTCDQVVFYEYQIAIIQQKINSLRLTSECDIDKKLHFYAVLDELENLLALVEEDVLDMDDKNYEEEEAPPINLNSELKVALTKKRRISFALENETLLFRHNEAVSQMLPKNPIQKLRDSITPDKDIITIDDESLGPQLKSVRHGEKKIDELDKKQNILKKVEENLQFYSDNDLISKIINEASTEKTIYITFKHNSNEPIEMKSNILQVEMLSEDFIPEKPSDFYTLYLKGLSKDQEHKIGSNIYVNAYAGEEDVKAPILREINRQNAYIDLRAKYSDPNIKEDGGNKDYVDVKSILRNKLAVAKEKHLPLTEKKKQQKSPVDEEEYLSAYYKVMNDVIEKPTLTAPEPLPEGNFIDAHTPKKRVSRFKQIRTGIEKT